MGCARGNFLERFGAMKRMFWLPLVLAWFAAAALAPAASAPHNFDRWEKEISAYEQADRTNPPPKGAVLFIGSSTVRLWKTLAQDFPEHRVINRGFGGSEIVDATHFAERVIFPYAPRMIFLRSGGNDLHAGKTAEQVFDDFKAFVATVHARMPEVEIAYIALAPSIARWSETAQGNALNTMVAQFARETPRVRYVDAATISLGPDGKPRPELFVADKLHFSPAGYQLLAERVRPHMPK